MILFGHNPPFIREAIEAQLRQGYEIGPQTTLAADVSRMVSELTGMERVAFCNTGSEAVTAAIRVARTVSGRDRIAMFAGAYHGVFDEVLVRGTTVDGHLRIRADRAWYRAEHGREHPRPRLRQPGVSRHPEATLVGARCGACRTRAEPPS